MKRIKCVLTIINKYKNYLKDIVSNVKYVKHVNIILNIAFLHAFIPFKFEMTIGVDVGWLS